jgi:xanthine dehydrogenase small subunit
MGAFRLSTKDRRVTSARIAFGGMAATPKRAPEAEAAIARASLDDRQSWQGALEALAADYQPIDDLRASAAYRRLAARAIFDKALREVAGADSRATRVFAVREAEVGRVA